MNTNNIIIRIERKEEHREVGMYQSRRWQDNPYYDYGSNMYYT